MNLILQQFENLKGGQEENKTDHNSPTMEGEKKINERINKVEEMIKREGRKDDQKSSQDGRSHGLPITLTFPSREIASQVQDANLG